MSAQQPLPDYRDANALAWKIDEFFADREEYKDFTYSINGLAAALRHIGVAE